MAEEKVEIEQERLIRIGKMAFSNDPEMSSLGMILLANENLTVEKIKFLTGQIPFVYHYDFFNHENRLDSLLGQDVNIF
jgi:hypothetical protein